MIGQKQPRQGSEEQEVPIDGQSHCGQSGGLTGSHISGAGKPTSMSTAMHNKPNKTLHVRQNSVGATLQGWTWYGLPAMKVIQHPKGAEGICSVQPNSLCFLQSGSAESGIESAGSIVQTFSKSVITGIERIPHFE